MLVSCLEYLYAVSGADSISVVLSFDEDVNNNSTEPPKPASKEAKIILNLAIASNAGSAKAGSATHEDR